MSEGNPRKRTDRMPEPFLDVRVHDLTDERGLSGLCVGYERGNWRDTQLVDHAMEWLPEFSLSHSEREGISSGNSVQLLRKAAKVVYKSDKFQSRGEFGELFLHIAVRQVFGSEPAISKIYYKSADNDTVKGFDAVHVVEGDEGLELWLGEAKFYNDISRAIRDVVAELEEHTRTDYLRTEFALIGNKIDDSWKHAEALKDLISGNTSLDEVFKRACIPILLTYDSDVVAAHTLCSEDYIRQFEEEIRKHHKTFSMKGLPSDVRLHLFLMPLKSKKELVEMLDGKLKTWQSI